MSFRARLTTFFVLIVVIPMLAMGVLVFGLIDSSAQSKADARAAGIADTAASVYVGVGRDGSDSARLVARELALVPTAQLPDRARALARRLGLARIVVGVGSTTAADVGSRGAIAPGTAVVAARGGRPQRTFTVSRMTADEYADQLAGTGTGTAIVVRQGARTLGSSDARIVPTALPAGRGTVSDAGARYRVITQRFPSFGSSTVAVSALSNLAVTSSAVTGDRMLAAGVILAFLLLAFVFTLLASRGLQRQVSHFLDAARRLGGGDFSAAVPTVGQDEFAALGEEFNSMSRQLQGRLTELERQRVRFRESIRRIGEAFASGLDRDALLELALGTAIDATEADRGRVSSRAHPADPLLEADHVGRLSGLETPLAEAERRALEGGGIGEAATGDAYVAAVALGPMEGGGPPHGVITVSREGRGFSEDDLELLRSLATRATLALANVNMHIDVARQAVTDDLTGLASHGRFQELLEVEMREVARYDYPVAIAMFDLDNFKSVNDTFGHQQGDVVLRRVAEVLRATCREADVPARYGGEEMALILPHTDLDGAFDLAERARVAIEGMAVPRSDHQGWLKVTTSVGVAASRDGLGEALLASADGALYAAKRSGKNRTARADAEAGADGAARELATSANAIDDE